MDDSTFPAVLAELHQHLIGLADWLRETPELDLATAEITTLARVRDIGGRLLEAGLAARGAGDRPDGGERRDHARSTASFEAAEAFGRRLAMLAHDQQVDLTDRVAVLGDGAAWIWNLAEEHLPGAVHIGDWYHARERVWELGRALDGPETAATATWVERQLNRLAAGEAATLAAAWHDLPCRGEAAQVREAQVTSVTNQASRMADDQYRAAGWDIGSGMIESACKAVIGQREKGAGMRWSEPGAQAVTNVRLLLFNDAWSDYWTTAA